MKSFRKSLVLVFVCILLMTNMVFAINGEESMDRVSSYAKDQNLPKTLKVNLARVPQSLDPQFSTDTSSNHLVNNTFEGLMREVNGQLQPAMAQKYEISQDKTVYTFTLRDAPWSDGKQVTADDFAYAWKRALDPENASEYAFQLYAIKGAQAYNAGEGKVEDVGIEVVDQKTLKVTLKEPTPYFLHATTYPIFMPTRQDVVEKDPEGWAQNPKSAISNGPFKLAEYKPMERILLVKNEDYWNAKNVKLHQIAYDMIADAVTMLEKYNAGELDVMEDMLVEGMDLSKIQKEEMHIFSRIGTYYYIFNTKQKPLDEKKVRRALTLAMNRKEIVEEITQIGQKPATGFVPFGIATTNGEDFREKAGNYAIDPHKAKVEEARKLLAEAGYPKGKGFPEIEIMYNAHSSHKRIAEAIQKMWKENLGIQTKLVEETWINFMTKRSEGDFFVAKSGWIGDYPDPINFLGMWTSASSMNDVQWHNAEYDALVEASKEVSGIERDELLIKLEKILMDEAVIMPIYYYTTPGMVKKHVKDWERASNGAWFFGNADKVK